MIDSIQKFYNKGFRYVMLAILIITAGIACSGNDTSSKNKPNVIIIFTDDQGYADVGKYGAEGFETPNLDRMADEGMRFTSFYVPASVCTPSRAGLLTGRYPMRVGLPKVLFPRDTLGLDTDELTIAELLKQEGYATQALGKWHLGAHPKFLPTNHGFDQFFGLPYSNDMSPEPANNPREEARKNFPPLPLIEDTIIVEREPDQAELVDRYTKRAVEFIKVNGEQPFFLYFAHHFPHVPLFATDKFQGLSERGLYGDVIQKIDWSVGQILKALEERGLRENTLVVFTSDNGPWLVFGDHGGSAGNLPEDKIIDGHDIWPILSGQADAESPYNYNPLYFYLDDNLQAVRLGPWKLHIPHNYLGVGKAGSGGDVGEYKTGKIGLALYNVEEDPGETQNVANENPEIIEQLRALVEQGRQELGDAITDTPGSQRGDPGRVDRYWQALDEE